MFSRHRRWSKIASHFPGRTDNEIKNHWNTRIKKRLKLLGVDPVTHKPLKQPADGQKSHVSRSNITEDDEEEDKITEIAESKDDEKEKGNGNVEATLDEEEMKLPLLEVNSSSSNSSSTSFEFSLDADSSNIEGSNQCWGENIDSFPSWETLYYLEDVLSFINYP